MLFKFFDSRDTSWLFFSRVVNLAKTPIILIFLILNLSLEEQGVWYLFISLAAIAYIAESGFGILIAQVISRNFIECKIVNNQLTGSKKNIYLIREITDYAISFYNKIMPFIILFNLLIGFWFLSSAAVEIKIAWTVYLLGCILNIYLFLFLSLYQGMRQIEYSSKIRTLLSTSNLILTSLFLILDFGIWSLAVGTILSAIIAIFFIKNILHNIFYKKLSYKLPSNKNWQSGLNNLIGKYFLSWISGYFILHIFVPLAYRIEGAEAAGKLGLLINFIKSASGLATSWVDSSIPNLNKIAGMKDHRSFKKLFYSKIKFSYLFFMIVSFFIMFVTSNYLPTTLLTSRVPNSEIVFIFIIMEFGYLTYLLLSKYLRAYLIEAFYKLNIFSAISIFTITYISLSYGSLFELSIGLSIFYWLILLPLAIGNFRQYNKRGEI